MKCKKKSSQTTLGGITIHNLQKTSTEPILKRSDVLDSLMKSKYSISNRGTGQIWTNTLSLQESALDAKKCSKFCGELIIYAKIAPEKT